MTEEEAEKCTEAVFTFVNAAVSEIEREKDKAVADANLNARARYGFGCHDREEAARRMAYNHGRATGMNEAQACIEGLRNEWDVAEAFPLKKPTPFDPMHPEAAFEALQAAAAGQARVLPWPGHSPTFADFGEDCERIETQYSPAGVIVCTAYGSLGNTIAVRRYAQPAAPAEAPQSPPVRYALTHSDGEEITGETIGAGYRAPFADIIGQPARLIMNALDTIDTAAESYDEDVEGGGAGCAAALVRGIVERLLEAAGAGDTVKRFHAGGFVEAALAAADAGAKRE